MARGRKTTLRTWDQVEDALATHGVMKSQVARYYGFPRQALNNAMKTAARLTLPNSEAWWQAINDISSGVTREGEAR